jgi:putative ABC transport system permease protein
MLFLLIGLMIAVSTVVTLINISEAMNEDITRKLDEYGANILIVPRSDDLSLSYGGMSVSGVAFDIHELHDSDIDKIKTIKNKDNISIVAPKLLNAANVQGQSENERDQKALIVGVDFGEEIALKKWWSIIGSLPREENGALIGSEVKRKMNIGLNQQILIKDKLFNVAGILEETGSQDDELIFINLNLAQQLFNKPKAISLIEVAALCYDCPIEEIVAQTSRKLPGAKVMAIRQTIQSKMETMHHFQSFSMGISMVIIFVGALIVFITMSASVNERIAEIGIFRAIGFRKSHIMKIILLETSFISGLAGLLGYVFGLMIAKNIGPMVGAQSNLWNLDPQVFLLVMLFSVVLGIGASFYPAYKASRLDPTTALRAI